ncbi:hypothetical protein [Bacteroides caecicola]|uniref:hypothetical protein n=1 Tax=Bacteroides caecicola TaxID=1462569 RepID=UPI002012FD08|nr:hypothetical protein [Bacteroides caecicola]MCL1626368.1 hypothetical protein [Bacteroides caecicola]
MKRFLVLVGMLLCVLMINAQYVEKKHQFGIELGVGGNGMTAVDFGLRWQTNFHPNVSWDVLTVKAVGCPEELGSTITPQVMTGIHLTSPEFAGMSAYVIARCGYGYWVEGESGDVCFEVGAGINLTKHVYIGYVFNHQSGDGDSYDYKYVDYTANYHAARIGFLF